MWIDPSLWQPIDVGDLEPKALEVVRSFSNYSVVAGPGAGKTELLAQRACFLLQTGICLEPRRILAISFKRDAAKNLRDRIAQRCQPELANRVDSVTFDSFAKGLLDRFLPTVPLDWRPTSDYEMFFPSRADFAEYLDSLTVLHEHSAAVAAIPRDYFERDYVVGNRLLPQMPKHFQNVGYWAGQQWWLDCLRRSGSSRLTFPMIGRLAALILATNQQILEALRATYSHVFMDEFQDTTHVQYDLIHTAFFNTSTVLTAVGDNCQSIMRWAMALTNAFAKFDADFNANRIGLIRNYRSSPALVQIQHQIALTIDPTSEAKRSMTENGIRTGEHCEVWEFATSTQEAQTLAQFVSSQTKPGQLKPHDFAILVRQKSASYAPILQAGFGDFGLKVQVQDDVQDLLSSPLAMILIAFLRTGASQAAGRYWLAALSTLQNLRCIDPENVRQITTLQDELSIFQETLAQKMTEAIEETVTISNLIDEILRFVDLQSIRAHYPEYRQGNFLDKSIGLFVQVLADRVSEVGKWDTALDELESIGVVPIMTIHKSKGLEYHTVIFLALDDKAWWSFISQPDDARAAFFVAFSRAKQRVIFTYCRSRAKRQQVESLYSVLRSAGVSTKVFS
jgi:superfamily I DNA/RNA helicase